MSITGISSSVLQPLLDSENSSVSTSSTAQSASASAISSASLLASSNGKSSTTSLDPLTQDLVNLLKDLASGDANSAKAALKQLQTDLKASSTESDVTKSLSSLFKDLTAGNTGAAKSDVTQLELDLGLKPSETRSSNATANSSESALEKLVTKLGNLLKSGSTDDALQAVASYLVQNGQGTGSLLNISA